MGSVTSQGGHCPRVLQAMSSHRGLALALPWHCPVTGAMGTPVAVPPFLIALSALPRYEEEPPQ